MVAFYRTVCAESHRLVSRRNAVHSEELSENQLLTPHCRFSNSFIEPGLEPAVQTRKVKKEFLFFDFPIQATRFKYAVCTLRGQSIFRTNVSEVSKVAFCAPVTGKHHKRRSPCAAKSLLADLYRAKAH